MKNSSVTQLLLALYLGFFSTQIFAANDEVDGGGTVTDVVLTDNVLWTSLISVTHTVNGGVGTNDCMVVASADVTNPGAASEKQYLFTITRNNTNPGTNGTAERTLGFVDNSGVDDINTQPVSTNVSFKNLTSTNGTAGTNQHTFYFLAKKKTADAPDATVEDSRIDFVCVDRD
ncbi:hypothetical protein Nit79A3_0524 [Nitrosomonas sp. Is79A3]